MRKPFIQRFVIGFASLLLAMVTMSSILAGRASEAQVPSVRERAACSSLALCKQPTEKALRAIADLGFQWVDLSCLNWAPHVSVPDLMKDFDKEAIRVESLLKQFQLKVCNLTFDSCEARPFEQYEKEFALVVKLAARLHTRLINIMAPSSKTGRQEAARKLGVLNQIASRSDVILTIETHVGQITEKAADALWLCQHVPGLGLTLDPSHYYAGPNQGADYDVLLPYVRGTGFRAGGMSWEEIQIPWGEGPIDFAKVVHKLETLGYRGFYVAEYIEGFNDLDPLIESKKFWQWAAALGRPSPTPNK